MSPPTATPPPLEAAKVKRKKTGSRAAVSEGKKGATGKEHNATERQPDAGRRQPFPKVPRVLELFSFQFPCSP